MTVKCRIPSFVFSHQLKLTGWPKKSFKFSCSHWAARLLMPAFAACPPTVLWSSPISLPAAASRNGQPLVEFHIPVMRVRIELR